MLIAVCAFTLRKYELTLFCEILRCRSGKYFFSRKLDTHFFNQCTWHSKCTTVTWSIYTMQTFSCALSSKSGLVLCRYTAGWWKKKKARRGRTCYLKSAGVLCLKNPALFQHHVCAWCRFLV